MAERLRYFAIKAEIHDRAASTYVFTAQKTMYGGRTIAVGDPIFLFASGTEGGTGLFARGLVSRAEAVPPTTALRQTPRMSIMVARIDTATGRLGRDELRAFRGCEDGSPEVELDFKLYRQATNKIVGLTNRSGAFLNDFF